MEKYSSYSPSGVEWIGEKPKYWISTKLKYVSTIITGNTPSKNNEDNYTDGKFLWIKPDGLNEFKPTNDCKEKISEMGLSETRIVPPYSVLINGIGNIGKFGYSELPVSTNQQIHSIVFEPQKVDKRYGLYLISSLKDEMNKNSEKVVVSIYTKSKLEKLDFILPPLQEQEQIVKYLDEKTTIIDKLISTKQRKVVLLKEQRTTLINQVITKGLNPNMKMKDSGVEWIGEIPEKWVVGKLNFYSDRIGDGLHSTPIYDDNGEYYFINGNNIKNGKIILTENTRKVNEIEFNNHFIKLSNSHTLLLSINGTIGNVSYFNDEKVILGKSVGYINLKKSSIDIDFLYWLLLSNSIQNYFQYELTGTTIYNLSLNSIRKTPILIPSLKEQKEIVEYLDKHTKEIDNLFSMEQNKIELLKEYRQSLISEVITGKIKVV
jgi:type I restriction enzyme S subunit